MRVSPLNYPDGLPSSSSRIHLLETHVVKFYGHCIKTPSSAQSNLWRLLRENYKMTGITGTSNNEDSHSTEGTDLTFGLGTQNPVFGFAGKVVLISLRNITALSVVLLASIPAPALSETPLVGLQYPETPRTSVEQHVCYFQSDNGKTFNLESLCGYRSTPPIDTPHNPSFNAPHNPSLSTPQNTEVDNLSTKPGIKPYGERDERPSNPN